MPQLSYGQEMDAAFAGMKADSRFDEVESFCAQEAIDFGVGVVKSDANPATEVRLPNITQIVLTDNAGTFTAGDVGVTVNGTVVTETFATDKATTMTNLAASIQALDTVKTAVYNNGAHTITIVAANDVNLVVSTDVTAVTGSMTFAAPVGTCADTFRGIALHTHQDNRTMPVLGSSVFGATGYEAGAAVNVLRKGVAWVVVADAVALDAAVYLIPGATTNAQFTDETTSPNILVPTAKFRSSTSGAGIAKVEINIP